MSFVQTLLIGLVGGVIGGFINYLFIRKKTVFELRENQKRKAYVDFLDKAKGFLNDPNLTRREALKKQQEFIEKVYNEIWVSASENVIKAVNQFFDAVSISYANEDKATKALNELVIEIRKDLGLKTCSDLRGQYKIYTPNLEILKKEKPE